MTFCIGIKVREGIVALADTRIVRGSEHVNKQKLAALRYGDQSVFTMTSGLRSVRDKTLIYLDEVIEQQNVPIDRLYKIANLFGEQLRRVRIEDGASLELANLTFNLHGIILGRLDGDSEPEMFYVYPAGNWVEAAADSPYYMIGRTTYGKPILDRLLTYETPLRMAVALAMLAFDATRASVTDVDFPIDIAVMSQNCVRPVFHRFTEQELHSATQWWSERLSTMLAEMPMTWADRLLSGLAEGEPAPVKASAEEV